MGFSRPEYRSGGPFPPAGDLANPGILPGSPALQILCHLSCRGSPNSRTRTKTLKLESDLLHCWWQAVNSVSSLQLWKYPPAAPGLALSALSGGDETSGSRVTGGPCWPWRRFLFQSPRRGGAQDAARQKQSSRGGRGTSCGSSLSSLASSACCYSVC